MGRSPSSRPRWRNSKQVRRSSRNARPRLQGREIEFKTELTRAKTQLESETHRANALAKNFETARTTSAKATELAARESAVQKASADLESREKRLAKLQGDLDSTAKILQR